MEKVVIKATRRDVTGKQVNVLRRSGKLPGVIYGRHTQPINITLDARSSAQALSKVTSSSLVTIDLDGKEYPALVREKQRDYIKGGLLHIDFLAVSLTEKIRAEVRIELTGVSPAVKDQNAVLVTGLHSLSVECLPTDLPDRVMVDISGLAQIGDGVHVRDVVLSDKVRVLDDPDEMVVVATFAKEEVIEEAPAAEAAVAEVAEGVEPELSVERGKKEEEVPEEAQKGEKAEKAAKPEKSEKK